MKKVILSISGIFIILNIISCSKPTEPSQGQSIPNYYAPLNVGDIRQLIFESDSSTFLMKAIYATKRQDGADIIAMEMTSGTHQSDTGYFFIKNGFYMMTDQYPISSTTNPFEETPIAETNPIDGDRFVTLVDYPDTIFLTAKYYNLRNTYCGTFSDVFGFMYTFQHAGVPDTEGINFYAKRLGFIGNISHNNSGPNCNASYIKVGNQEYGKLWPAKNISPISKVAKLVFKQIVTQMIFIKQTPANQALKLTE